MLHSKETEMIFNQGRLSDVEFINSPFFNCRPEAINIDLLVIHNISLPPKQYGGAFVKQLFTGTLDTQVDPIFAELSHYQVSSHFFIDRKGKITQFVSCDDRAWHAGQSNFMGREACNDFSIGIELEGCDTDYFTIHQYESLTSLTQAIITFYPIQTILGHSDIAPQRKTDPGPFFNWSYYEQRLLEIEQNENQTKALFNYITR